MMGLRSRKANGGWRGLWIGATTVLVFMATVASAQAVSVYVTNAEGDSVSQYSVGFDGVLSPKTPPSLAAGASARRVAVSPDGQSVYVTSNEKVFQYDVGVGGMLSPKTPPSVTATRSPVNLAVRPDGT